LFAVAQRAKAEAETISSDLRKIVSTPKIKNISLYQNCDSVLYDIHPVPLRGALAIVTTRDGLRWTRMCRKRAVLTRTAKTCGPDAAVLASSWRSGPLMTEAKEPFSGEITL
jgi:hypothetical protein